MNILLVTFSSLRDKVSMRLLESQRSEASVGLLEPEERWAGGGELHLKWKIEKEASMMRSRISRRRVNADGLLLIP